MIIQGLEINYGNISDWSANRLWHFRHQLRLNIKSRIGNTSEEQLLAELMTIEIKRKQKVEKINLSADVKVKQLMNKSNKAAALWRDTHGK